MRKNACPYLNSQNRCTHKNAKYKLNRQFDCIYNNPLKCRLYNSWLESRKSLRMAVNNDERVIRNWLEDFKRRFIKTKQ